MNSVGFKTQVLSQPTVTDAVRLLVDEYGVRNQTLTAIQVGACNGDIDNDHLHEVVKDKDHVEAHLIEAVGWLFEQLVEAMALYAEHIHCHHAALGARDEIRPFYSVSPRFGVDHPEAQDWVKYQIGSLTDEHLKMHVPETYISSQVMQVWSPATFMHRTGINPEDVNLLMTDTEGFDGEIIGAFLETTRPEMVVYEHHIMPIEENESLHKLLDHLGYGHKVIGYDVLACRARE